MSKAVVLLSGGMDSAVCMAIACHDHDDVIPIHFNYGQQTEDFEEEQAMNQIGYYMDHHDSLNSSDVTIHSMRSLDYSGVFHEFSGGITTDRASFENEDGSMEEEDGRSTGFVPMRNLHFLSSAAAIADVEDADAVYIGAQANDEEAYPDCRPAFMQHAQAAINRSMGDDQSITVETPILKKSKPDVVELGEALNVPWEYTYSCYQAIEGEPEPCGACPACEERAQAFKEVGVKDPFGTVEAYEEEHGVIM